MNISDLPMKMSVLITTQAFQRRDKSWPFESWDYTEWDECLHEAKKELKAKESS
jgi:hypothetical protein